MAFVLRTFLENASLVESSNIKDPFVDVLLLSSSSSQTVKRLGFFL